MSESVGGMWLLGRGIRGLLRCDGAEVVEGIARYVVSQHASLRVGSALLGRARGTPLPAAAALLGGLPVVLVAHAASLSGALPPALLVAACAPIALGYVLAGSEA